MRQGRYATDSVVVPGRTAGSSHSAAASDRPLVTSATSSYSIPGNQAGRGTGCGFLCWMPGYVGGPAHPGISCLLSRTRASRRPDSRRPAAGDRPRSGRYVTLRPARPTHTSALNAHKIADERTYGLLRHAVLPWGLWEENRSRFYPSRDSYQNRIRAIYGTNGAFFASCGIS